jgi:predicted RNA binding protein YcfA (HicA-like mRNA interferase family)
MVQGFTKQVIAILEANGCRKLRQGKGDHAYGTGPLAKRPFPVDGKIMSRAVANAVLKQAGLKDKI